MTPTPPQERANTAEVAEVLARAQQAMTWLSDLDRKGKRYNCECQVGGVDAMSVDTDWLLARIRDLEPLVDLAAASLLRHAPPQVAGEDVERVARALFDADYAHLTPEQRDLHWSVHNVPTWCERARVALAALSARPVEAQEVKRVSEARRVHLASALQRENAARAEAEQARGNEAILDRGMRMVSQERDALRAVVEAVRDLVAAHTESDCTGDREWGEIPYGTLRTILDTPALSAQPVAQEGEEEWGHVGRRFWEQGLKPRVTICDDEDEARAWDGPARMVVRRTVTPWVPVETGGEGK